MNEQTLIKFNRAQFIAFFIGVVGTGAACVGTALNPHELFVSYLFSYTFWLGLTLGCLGVAMIHSLTGGTWGFVTRRFLEAGFMTLPVMALLFVPLFFGIHELYPWAKYGLVVSDPILAKKHAYLNTPGFIVRAVVYFIIWLAMAWPLRKWSLRQDLTQDVAPTMRMRTLSGPGIVIYPVVATFAFIDWVMSIDPDWYSTMFPVVILSGQVLTAFALVIIVLALVEHDLPFVEIITSDHFLKLGNLLFAFVIFWTYVSFGQLLVIYSGNLPDEISWYRRRIVGTWQWFILFIAAFHFFLPFLLLLFRPMKRRLARLVRVAVLVFFMQALAIFWTVVPVFRPAGIRIVWTDFAVFFGMGGLWIALFFLILKRQRLLPQNDPRIEFSSPATADAQ